MRLPHAGSVDCIDIYDDARIRKQKEEDWERNKQDESWIWVDMAGMRKPKGTKVYFQLTAGIQT
jgi:hypothetical protein